MRSQGRGRNGRRMLQDGSTRCKDARLDSRHQDQASATKLEAVPRCHLQRLHRRAAESLARIGGRRPRVCPRIPMWSYNASVVWPELERAVLLKRKESLRSATQLRRLAE